MAPVSRVRVRQRRFISSPAGVAEEAGLAGRVS